MMRAPLILLLSSTAALADVALQWGASTDASGVAGYAIYRNGALVGTSPTNSFVDTSAPPGAPQTYEVSAFDIYNNESGKSSAIIVNTLLAAFPSASNTGVPAGTVLTTYTGPCILTTPGTTIDAKTVNCSLEIQTSGVVISRSKINGGITLNTALGPSASWNFIVRDSEIDAGGSLAFRGIQGWNYTALRNNIYGSYSGLYCVLNAVIQDNYVHGNALDPTGIAHMSAIRQEADCTIRHNTILCDAPVTPPDCCCSAGLTGYPDFAIIQRNTIDRNLFKASPMSAYCAYGGSTLGKPFSGQTNNIRFTNNVFERGPENHCGAFAAVSDFDPAATGNVWTNNKYDDGCTISNDGITCIP
jgi:hypothetical protein